MAEGLTVDGLTVAYGTITALESVSLAIPPGKITVLAGPNGCGKSSLLRAIRHLAEAQSGRILIGDTDVSRLGPKEIARAIDVSALGDAWGRYQAGESNVFSRRIYTLSGQGTYDEVRKKLQRDPEFARTAQAYMAEFEQLLKRAAAGPRPAEESREYLLSDRGKVYTMLAHASGRLN